MLAAFLWHFVLPILATSVAVLLGIAVANNELDRMLGGSL
jgi:hypothetical protein